MADQFAPVEKISLRDLGAAAGVFTFKPGVLYGVSILNAAGATAFIQLFDRAQAGDVAIGTTVPDYEVSLASATSQVFPLLPGVKFRLGCIAASTTTEKGATPSAAGIQAFFLVI